VITADAAKNFRGKSSLSAFATTRASAGLAERIPRYDGPGYSGYLPTVDEDLEALHGDTVDVIIALLWSRIATRNIR
jgi:hypothetical protein